MDKYFNIYFEFDRQKLHALIENTLAENGKGFVGVVDGNVLSIAKKDIAYREIINNALVNTCDGSSIALMVNKIYKKKFQAYTGPELFEYYIRKNYKQYFLGNTTEILNQLRSSFQKEGLDMKSMLFSTLPFLNVEDFDYPEIARMINESGPELIWVSLGAPKQEIFISKLLPYINTGVMFAIGAAFNLYLNGNKSLLNVWFRYLHLGWVLRVLKEPKRIGFRAINYIVLIPGLIKQEIKLRNQSEYNR